MTTAAVEIAADSFNRADSADIGTNWTPVVNSLKIVGNQVRPSALSVSCWERYSGITWGPDQFSEITVRASASGEGAGPVVRMSTGTPETGYFAEAQGAVAGKLWKAVAGAYTQIGTLPVINTGDKLRLRVLGTVLTVSVNGIDVFTISDAAISSGDAGIKAINTTDGNSQLDDWAGGRLVTPPLYPLYPDRLSQARSEQAADNFNRADSGNLGANWTQGFGGPTLLQIVSNQVQATNLSAVNLEYYSAISWPADQYSEVTIISVNASGDGPGVAVRCSSTANTYYAFQTSSDTLIRVVAGTLTILASGQVTFATNDVLRLEVEGNILRLLKNGIVIYQVKDATITGGSPGIYISPLGDAGNTAVVDNWKGGSLVPRPYYGEATRPNILDPQHAVGLYY